MQSRHQSVRVKNWGEGPLTVRVVEQKGPLIRLVKDWETPGAPGSVGGKEVEKATEPMVGVIGYDGKTVYFAEQGDNGLYTGRLVDDDTLQLVYIEAGNTAVAYSAEIKRQK